MAPGSVRPLAPATHILLLLNGVAFAYVLWLGSWLEPFLYRWGAVSQEIQDFLSGAQTSPAVLVTLLSALFLHAGWVHLATNMLYLWFFGERVERRLGSGPFLGLYLCAGVGGGIGQVLATPGALVPAIGASGAVAGLIGAYLALQPGSTMAALAPRLFYRPSVDLSAALLLALWLVAQTLVGTLAIADLAYFPSVGWWAHLAGFGVGLTWGLLVVHRGRAAVWTAPGAADSLRHAGGAFDRVEKIQHEWGSR